MGSDIHLYVERKSKDGVWHYVRPPVAECEWCSKVTNPDCLWCKGTGRRRGVGFYSGRNYTLFSVLAGVRNYNKVMPIAFPRGQPNDLSQYVTRRIQEFGSDGHSHSFLGAHELLGFAWEQQISGDVITYRDCCADFYEGFLPKLAELADKYGHYNVRVVFFFDN